MFQAFSHICIHSSVHSESISLSLFSAVYTHREQHSCFFLFCTFFNRCSYITHVYQNVPSTKLQLPRQGNCKLIAHVRNHFVCIVVSNHYFPECDCRVSSAGSDVRPDSRGNTRQPVFRSYTNYISLA